MSQDPTRAEMLDAVDHIVKAGDISPVEVEAAIYWFATEYHSGQTSNLYAALSESKYRPGKTMQCIEDTSDEAIFVYDEIVGNFG